SPAVFTDSRYDFFEVSFSISRSSSVNPKIACMGVLISWLILAIKLSFWILRFSASSLELIIAFSASISLVISWAIFIILVTLLLWSVMGLYVAWIQTAFPFLCFLFNLPA